ncbi:LuxR C-terminal-related transcriptional regulator, partial [Streptomyces sp. NPDC052644]
LDDQTHAVYVAMLHHPGHGVAELATHLGLDEPAIRAALDTLARLSLLHPSGGEPQPLRPISPEIGLTALLAERQAELTRRQLEIEESRAAVALLLADQAGRCQSAAEPSMERLVGVDAVRGRLVELARSCRSELCAFMPGGAQTPASLAASRPLDEASIRRGVRLRTVYLDSIRNDPATLAYAGWLCQGSSEVRTGPALPLRMLVVDRERALLPIDSESSGLGAVLLSGSGVVAGLLALFESVWSAAAPLGAPRPRDDRGLSRQEEQVLTLLVEGHIDEVIARRLGVSVRTGRRLTADLMQRLGARSRFQAGALAVARGWV